ncbi:MAG: hypothetical protein H6606_10800 [Flavobacteriales bacterium]|nr:hypothetical protein [Flavobacteriales bacterium]
MLQAVGRTVEVPYSDPSELIKLGRGVAYLRDAEGRMKLEDVSAKHADWRAFQGEVLNFQNTTDAIWLHFSVENHCNEPLFLLFGNAELDHVQSFLVLKGKVVREQRSGNLHPFETRYMYSNRVCLPLDSGSYDVYLRITTRASFYLPLYLGSMKALSKVNYRNSVFNGITIGVMLVILLYNFILFLAIPDPLYLRYCAYLLFSTSLMAFIQGIPYSFIWPEHPEINRFYFTNIIIAGATISAIRFSTSFLNIQEHTPKLKWLNRTLILLAILTVCVELVFRPIMVNALIQAVSGTTSLYLFVLGIVYYIKGFQRAKYYVLSWGVLVSGAIIYILTLNGVLEIHFLTLNSFQLASMAEGVLLSFALADRIHKLREEKRIAQEIAIQAAEENERLIREQNVHLEEEVHMRTRELEVEKQKSEDLLLNILPKEIADQLKAVGESEARLYNDVSVLFTDFVNFTGIGAGLSPQDLVHELHTCFKAFDRIVEKHGLEKIKTIGDAYMAAGGVPVEDREHARKATLAALEISDHISEYRRNGGLFEIRIGISSGPVVAGIIGVRKFQYDLWGDTVNTAARMEHYGEIGAVNISQSTYEQILSFPEFDFTDRGMVNVKGKGMLHMYLVRRSSITS